MSNIGNWTTIYETEYLVVAYDVINAIKEFDQTNWTVENHLAVKNYVCILAATINRHHTLFDDNLTMALAITGLEHYISCRKWAVDKWNNRLQNDLANDMKKVILECVKSNVAKKVIADIEDISKRIK